MNKFNTPVKRSGFVILIFGLILILIGFFTRCILDQEGMLDVIKDSLYLYTWSSSYSLTFVIGLYTSVLGAILSFAYDIGVGRVIAWIKKGQ